MRKILLFVAATLPLLCPAQIGIKAGVNFTNVTNASSINSASSSGFMGGLFLAPQTKSIISSRTEIVYSRQGYNFSSGVKSGKVDLDYILLPQLMGINISKFLQLQLGMQMAYLLNAKADSTTSSGASNPYAGVMDYYNRFDYGFAAGVEIKPVLGLLIGARWNISLGKLYKDALSGQQPSFASVDAKNNVVQLYAGWRFGK